MTASAPPSGQAIDAALAAALRNGAVPVEAAAWSAETIDLAVERALYHGISGMLAALPGWPPAFLATVRAEALGRAMWELRHRQLLGRLLDRIGEAGRRALLLKGSALAYSLYPEPAARSRGDSDLWVSRDDVAEVRAILEQEGFRCDQPSAKPSALQLEEGWSLIGADGNEHAIDLHWSAVNSAALRHLFDFETCWEQRRPLASLSAHAWSLDPADALLHTAVHRRLHVVSPYLVGDLTYHGGDRLIWAMDVHLLVEALGVSGLRAAAGRAASLGLGPALREALRFAREALGTSKEDEVFEQLKRTERSPAARFLASGPLGRAWLDLQGLPTPAARVREAARKIFPSRAFLASKYRERRAWRLPWLFFRRLAGLVGKRPSGIGR